MSVAAQANGAQREIGMYAGVDGTVRKLFDEVGISNPNGIEGTAAGMQAGVPFDVSGYTLVIAYVFGGSVNSMQYGFFVVLPKLKLSFNLKVFSEYPYEATIENGNSVSIKDRNLSYNSTDNTLTFNSPNYTITNYVRLYA